MPVESSDANNKKPPKAAWPMVTIPNLEGGLGVLNLQTRSVEGPLLFPQKKNLQTRNGCLLLKHLHKFYNRLDTSWVLLVWYRHYAEGCLPRLFSNFRGSF